jgi:integrase
MKLSETGEAGIWVRSYPGGRKRLGWTIYHEGRSIRRVCNGSTVRQAAVERNKALERLLAGQPVDAARPAPPYTVIGACDAYLKACESLRSVKRYEVSRAQLRAYFGDLPVSALSQVTIAGYRRSRAGAKKKVSGATVNRDLALLRAALNHAQAEGKIEGHYLARKMGKADRRKIFVEEPRTAGLRRVTDKQFLAVLAKLSEPWRPVARLLLMTAMRRGEALGLRWGDVGKDTLTIRQTKTGKPREIPMSRSVAAVLPPRPLEASDDDPVFRVRPTSFGWAWGLARKAAGVPWLRIHDLRHEGASRFVEAGGTLRELQELGGWQTLKMVERYSKTNRVRIREALDRVALPAEETGIECTRSARQAGATISASAK